MIHQPSDRTGVLLTNLGTPDAPTTAAVRRYLREFLSDPRVVEAPRAIWWLVLNLFVLPFRPRRSASLYARIWSADGSPLLSISERQAEALRVELAGRAGTPLAVALGMRYGNPSLSSALRSLQEQGCRRIIVLPMYPQYSASTVASTFDAVTAELARQRALPSLVLVSGYHDRPGYIRALASSIREFWAEHGRADRLLMSFHGIPVRYADAGDPYPDQCRQTAALLARELGLEEGAWQLAFQSRFGREEWVQPYTVTTLEEWGRDALGSVDVVCPGFPADCLETLEEIALTNRGVFRSAGGGVYRYIPALNDRDDHIAVLADIVREYLPRTRP